jgi:hypothetical protein
MTCLFSFLPEKLPLIRSEITVNESPIRTWFSQGGVLICRSATNDRPFAVSLKGGHNAENHNHNDVGSFIVVAGKSMVLVDPGSEVYTARTFSPHRYDSDVLNSFGHDVPVVAGKLQRSGIKAHAETLETKFTNAQDFWAMDISSAYNVPTLTKLERRFTFSRGNDPSLTVRDDVAFSKADSFETALITWGKWKQISPSELLFSEEKGGVRVKIETEGVPFEIISSKLQADVPTPKATRIGIRLQQPVSKASVTLTIVPEKM